MAKRKQKISRDINKPPVAASKFPAISVIIPVYNTEKYIGECLDSLLAQTFQDFEVIVVDDCSTDNSFAIVESYKEKFGGRLLLTKTKKNSGNAGYSARNKGFTFSRGEYIFFMDSDDMVIKTALEELYTAAKEFDTDVVYTSSFYRYTSESGAKLTTDRIGEVLKKEGLEDKPSLTIDDPHKNLQAFFNGSNGAPWTKFVSRSFLTEKEITFYEILSGGDAIWTNETFACAERLLRLPKAVYLWRDDSMDSITRIKLPTEKQIAKWIKSFIFFAEAVTDLSNKLPILKENPIYSYAALYRNLRASFGRNSEARNQVDSEKIYEILRSEFENKDDLNLMVPFMFSLIDEKEKINAANIEYFNQFAAQAQAQVNQFNQFVAQAQQRIAELENEIRRLKS